MYVNLCFNLIHVDKVLYFRLFSIWPTSCEKGPSYLDQPQNGDANAFT